MNREKIIVIDFGGQYNQLVARRVRECSVYCEIYSYKTDIEQIKAMNPKGIILTGGPDSCYEEGAASCGRELFELGIPVLVDYSSYESNPLGRTEWVRLYGILTGKEAEAEAAFAAEAEAFEAVEQEETADSAVEGALDAEVPYPLGHDGHLPRLGE